jgi:transcriptional regulator with XRE-family HTH domain
MFTNPTAKILRAKKLGVLIRDARIFACRSLSECAETLGMSQPAYEAYELGEQSPSLPELELLSYFFGVPLEHFYSNQLLERNHRFKENFDLEVLIGLRQRMIGALIRKARKEADLSLESLAETSGIAPAMLEAYELGERPVPVPELDAIAFALGSTVKDFQDQHGPVGMWFAQEDALKGFQNLSPEMQAFVSKQVNRPYLELAQRLSDLSVEKLRSVAEILLEITL